MSAENKALVRRWFQEVWEQGNPAAIHELLAADAKCHGFPDPAGFVDFDGFVATHKSFVTAFSGIQVTIHDLFAEDDRVAVRITCTMQHTGEGMGMPPTGETVTLQGSSITHMVNGQIAEGWNYFDVPGMVAKLHSCAVAEV